MGLLANPLQDQKDLTKPVSEKSDSEDSGSDSESGEDTVNEDKKTTDLNNYLKDMTGQLMQTRIQKSNETRDRTVTNNAQEDYVYEGTAHCHATRAHGFPVDSISMDELPSDKQLVSSRAVRPAPVSAEAHLRTRQPSENESRQILHPHKVDDIKLLITSTIRQEIQQHKPQKWKSFDAVIVFDRRDYDIVLTFKSTVEQIMEYSDINEHVRIELYESEHFVQSKVRIVDEVISKCSVIFLFLTNNCDTPYFNFFCEEAIARLNLDPCNMSTFASVNAFDNPLKCVLKPVHTLPTCGRNYKTPPGLASLNAINWYDKDSSFTRDKIISTLKSAITLRKRQEKEENTRRDFKFMHNTPTASLLLPEPVAQQPVQPFHQSSISRNILPPSFPSQQRFSNDNTNASYQRHFMQNSQFYPGANMHPQGNQPYLHRPPIQQNSVPFSQCVPGHNQSDSNIRQRSGMSNPQPMRMEFSSRGQFPQVFHETQGQYQIRLQHSQFRPPYVVNNGLPSHQQLIQNPNMLQTNQPHQHLSEQCPQTQTARVLSDMTAGQPGQHHIMNNVPIPHHQSRMNMQTQQINHIPPMTGSNLVAHQPQYQPFNQPLQEQFLSRDGYGSRATSTHVPTGLRDESHDTPLSSDLKVVSKVTGKLIVNPNLSTDDVEIDTRESIVENKITSEISTQKFENDLEAESESEDSFDSADSDEESEDEEMSSFERVLRASKGKTVNIIGSQIIQIGANNIVSKHFSRKHPYSSRFDHSEENDDKSKPTMGESNDDIKSKSDHVECEVNKKHSSDTQKTEKGNLNENKPNAAENDLDAYPSTEENIVQDIENSNYQLTAESNTVVGSSRCENETWSYLNDNDDYISDSELFPEDVTNISQQPLESLDFNHNIFFRRNESNSSSLLFCGLKEHISDNIVKQCDNTIQSEVD